jgi:non-canonical poly(A) RNA polymerase PAPD5/7
MHPKIRLGEIDPFENLGVLLVEFFEFYGSFFNYNNLGMSINKGGSYFPKAQRGWQDLMKPWMLSISDPADESTCMHTRCLDFKTNNRRIANDVSRGSFQMLRLRQTLGGAALILKARLLEVSGQIQSIQDGYYYRLRPAEPIQTVLGRLVAISPEVSKPLCDWAPIHLINIFQTIRRRIAIQDAFDSRKIHISLSIPFPSFIGVEGEHPEKSDMEVSDREGSSRVQPSSPSRSRTLPKDTHRLSEDEGENEEDDDEVKEHDSDGAAEESRYASTKPNAKASSSTSRNLLNRFDSDKVTQFVMSSSDDGEEGSLAEEGEEQMAISHARKKRKIEESTVQPGVIRRSSKRAYWAGKVNPE